MKGSDWIRKDQAIVEPRNEVPSLEELKAMLQEKTQRNWSEIAYEEGIREGRQKGRQEGRLRGHVEILEEQLETKFGPLDEATRARLHEASSDDLLLWSTQLLTSDRLDEVFS